MTAHQAPLSLGFSRQEHWSGLPFPSPMLEGEKVKLKSLSRVRLLATPWTAAFQAPPSTGFSRQEYWSGVPLPSPEEYLLLLLLSHFSCVRPCATHRRQPTRLRRPWDSPGRSTGVGCHFLLQCMKVKSESEVAHSK